MSETVDQLTREHFGAWVDVPSRGASGYLYVIRDEYHDGYPSRHLVLVDENGGAVEEEFTDANPSGYPKTMRTACLVRDDRPVDCAGQQALSLAPVTAAADRAKAAESRPRWIDGEMAEPWWRDMVAGITAEHADDLEAWAERVATAYGRSGTLGVTACIWALLDALSAARAEGEAAATQRWTTARDALAEELAGDSKDAMKRADAARKRGQESGARELYTANVRHARVAAHAAAALRGLVPTSSEEEMA